MITSLFKKNRGCAPFPLMVTTRIFARFLVGIPINFYLPLVGNGQNPRNIVLHPSQNSFKKHRITSALEFRFGEMLRVAMIFAVASGHLQGVLRMGFHDVHPVGKEITIQQIPRKVSLVTYTITTFPVGFQNR